MKKHDGWMLHGRFLVRPVGESVHRPATASDAAVMRGMLARGDKQSDVASYFATNSGRVCEVNTGRRFPGVPPAAGTLPPPGPHVAGPNIEIIGIADRFASEQRRTNEKLDNMQRLLCATLRAAGLLENPKTPRLSRRTMLGG